VPIKIGVGVQAVEIQKNARNVADADINVLVSKKILGILIMTQ